jgi:type IV secretory pathway VirB10-like protein
MFLKRMIGYYEAAGRDTGITSIVHNTGITFSDVAPKPVKAKADKQKSPIVPNKPIPAPVPKVAPQKPPISPTKAPAKPPMAQAAVAQKEKKSTTNRREELLKQLKAVEDAIEVYLVQWETSVYLL